MRRARPLPQAGLLTPIIGVWPYAAPVRRRSGAPTRWRNPASQRVFPTLRLSIQPTWRLNLNYSVTFADRNVTVLPEARPRGLEFVPIRLVSAKWRILGRTGTAASPLSVGPTAAGRDTFGAAVDWSSLRAKERPSGRFVGAQSSISHMWRGPIDGGFMPLSGSPLRVAERPALDMTHRMLDVRREFIAGAPPPAGQSKMRAPGTGAPRSIGRSATAPHPLVAARRQRPITTIVMSATTRPHATPALALGRLTVDWRRPAATQTRPHRTRPRIDLDWRPPGGDRAATQELVTLARAIGSASAPGPMAAALSRALPAAPPGAQVANLPDAGRLVDEVMNRIERRIRSDRFRRGL